MLLIFDLDGTLFQAKPVVLITAERFCREIDAPLPQESLLYKNAGTFLRAVLPESSDINAVRVRYDSVLHETVTRQGELYPGIFETLEALAHEGHDMIVVSASGREYIRLALEATGIAGFFSSYYSSEGFTSKAELISRLITPDTQAAVIGDTHGDIEAAQACGLPSVAVMYGYGNRELLSGADYFAASPQEILQCIAQIEA